VIEAYITNLGKYVEGKLCGEWLSLPATKEEVQALLSRIGVDGVFYEEAFITDYDHNLAGMQNLGEYESIDELNYLASLLEEMDKGDLEKFEVAAVHGDYSESVQDLINLAQNLECYEYYPGVESYDALGRYLIDELGYEEIPEQLERYFDYESYAEDYVINEGGEFLESGFVFRNSLSFQEHYNGRDDLPDEHRIFAYPTPEPQKEQKPSIQKTIQALNEQIAQEQRATPTTERPQPTHKDR